MAWATAGGIISVGGWTLLTLHAYAGLALVPLLAVHLVPRRWRLLWPGRWLRAWILRGLGASRMPAVAVARRPWSRRSIIAAGVLAAAGPDLGATRVDVRSVTGWGAGLSIHEADRTLLATHVAGEPLPAGNGAPCRLVVPGRRGLDWVKWVTEIEVA